MLNVKLFDKETDAEVDVKHRDSYVSVNGIVDRESKHTYWYAASKRTELDHTVIELSNGLAIGALLDCSYEEVGAYCSRFEFNEQTSWWRDSILVDVHCPHNDLDPNDDNVGLLVVLRASWDKWSLKGNMLHFINAFEESIEQIGEKRLEFFPLADYYKGFGFRYGSTRKECIRVDYRRAMSIASSLVSKARQLIEAFERPILLVEGKTDVELIELAWDKLERGRRAFDVVACGIEPLPGQRNGGAEMLRRCLEFLTIASDKPIVGLFDNDRIGNEQFTGVNRKAFDQTSEADLRKHKTKSAYAVLLPVCPGRELFVTQSDMSQRYLSIEHYFRDEVLEAHNMKGPSILGTVVFEITGDKVAFAERAASLDKVEFQKFEVLFDRVTRYLK